MPRYLVSHRLLAVVKALGSGVGHNAENRQHREHRVDQGNQVVLQVPKVQLDAEHAAAGLDQEQDGRDQSDPALALFLDIFSLLFIYFGAFPEIEMADEIYVINVGGYIGSSTRSEIEYATEKGMPVRYLEDEQ